MLYVLKSDISDFGFDYDVFGIYTGIEDLLHAANVIFNDKYSKAKEIQDEYDFSGLVFYPIRNDDINKVDFKDNKWSINYNVKTNNFYIKAQNLEYLKKQNVRKHKNMIMASKFIKKLAIKKYNSINNIELYFSFYYHYFLAYIKQ